MALKSPGTGGLTSAGGVIHQSYLDNSGTPGNATSNTGRGRAAFAAAASTITITNNLVVATSSVFVSINSSDATAFYIRATAPGAGSFTCTLNAASTAAVTFDFLVVN